MKTSWGRRKAYRFFSSFHLQSWLLQWQGLKLSDRNKEKRIHPDLKRPNNKNPLQHDHTCEGELKHSVYPPAQELRCCFPSLDLNFLEKKYYSFPGTERTVVAKRSFYGVCQRDIRKCFRHTNIPPIHPHLVCKVLTTASRTFSLFFIVILSYRAPLSLHLTCRERW